MKSWKKRASSGAALIALALIANYTDLKEILSDTYSLWGVMISANPTVIDVILSIVGIVGSIFLYLAYNESKKKSGEGESKIAATEYNMTMHQVLEYVLRYTPYGSDHPKEQSIYEMSLVNQDLKTELKKLAFKGKIRVFAKHYVRENKYERIPVSDFKQGFFEFPIGDSPGCFWLANREQWVEPMFVRGEIEDVFHILERRSDSTGGEPDVQPLSRAIRYVQESTSYGSNKLQEQILRHILDHAIEGSIDIEGNRKSPFATTVDTYKSIIPINFLKSCEYVNHGEFNTPALIEVRPEVKDYSMKGAIASFLTPEDKYYNPATSMLRIKKLFDDD